MRTVRADCIQIVQEMITESIIQPQREFLRDNGGKVESDKKIVWADYILPDMWVTVRCNVVEDGASGFISIESVEFDGHMCYLLAFLLQEGELISRSGSVREKLKTSDRTVTLHDDNIASWREYLKGKYPDVYFPPFNFRYGKKKRMITNFTFFLGETGLLLSSGLAIAPEGLPDSIGDQFR